MVMESRSRGRQRIRWRDIVKRYKIVGHRMPWRQKTQTAYPMVR